MHYDSAIPGVSQRVGLKVQREPVVNSIKVDVVKGKSIPDLDSNKHFGCRGIELTATQFDIFYAIVEFDGIARPDPKRDTMFIELRALEIFDNFDSQYDKGW